MPATRLMLLWHMHQPYYKDLADGCYAMPWARLHALKDYYGMVAMMREFPSVHLTFNLVPSLLAQIRDYANGEAREESYDLAFRPASELSPGDKAKLVKYAFQVNHENLMSRYPRFQELFALARGGARDPRPEPISGTRDIRDLQVLSQLAWLDEIYLARDPELKELAARQRDYTEADKLLLRKKEAEILKATVEEYRAAQSRGQAELSTSPFYHPILPLLCDTDAGADSSPGLPLPRRRFRHPEDARAQLHTAVEFHRETFGARPAGLWPSEGSVSENALRLAVAEGFKWAATDEGVLARSLRASFRPHGDGSVEDAHQLYQPRRFQTSEGPIDLFFRDHSLSDLIGFVYARMDPGAAAHDLLQRIRHAARSAGPAPVISVILDGENAWEYYPGNGREFLKRFYGLLAGAPDIEALTPSEILAAGEPAPLPRLIPGSWINANFNVWIGAEEDNRAWDLLSEARDFFQERSMQSGLSQTQIEAARQELWIAEGSDWCWWYGPEHSSANDEEFDELYRKHLGNLYRLLGGIPPDELAEPVKRPRLGGSNVPPSAPIQPVIDGRETTYFEWLGAGVYTPDPRSASLHESQRYIRELHYACSREAVSLRIDMAPEFLAQGREFELHLKIGRDNARLHARIANGSLDGAEFWLHGETRARQNGFRVAFDSIFEAEIEYSTLALGAQQKTALQASVWVDRLPVQIVPREGWLSVEMADELTAW
ncbi:MAG: glycoside hydrolase family 57 protein [Terriglobia bacterium]